jgi:hypothetical protein
MATKSASKKKDNKKYGPQVTKKSSNISKSAENTIKKNTDPDVKVINIKKEFLIPFAIILVLFITLLISIFTSGFKVKPFGIGYPTDEELKTKAADYINTTLLQGQGTAEITKVERFGSNLKKITFPYNSQDIDAFITLDGSKLYVYGKEYELNPDYSVEDGKYSKTDKPKAQFFTMSFCPYGNQAEGMIDNVRKLLGDKIELEPHYVIYSDYAKNGGVKWQDYCTDETEKYCSMHGIQELNQDVREMCVYQNQTSKYWDFVMAVNLKCTAQDVDTCWEGVANDTGVNASDVKSCFTANRDTILASEAALGTEKEVQGSPTIFINDVAYDAARNPEAFKNALCSSFNDKPKDCDTTLSTSTPDSQGQCN